jgi:hypothetical protein
MTSPAAREEVFFDVATGQRISVATMRPKRLPVAVAAVLGTRSPQPFMIAVRGRRK